MIDRAHAQCFRRGILVLAAVYLLVLVAGAVLTASWPRPASAARGAWWVLKTGAVLAWQLGFLLARQRRVLAGENLRHLWGAANRITLAQALVGVPLLTGFLRDGLAAAGLIDPRHPAYQRWKGRIGRLAFGWGPPLLRTAAGAAAALRIAVAAGIRGGDALAAWRAAVLLWPPPARPAATAAAASLQLVSLAVLAAGWPRRAVTASALLFLLVEGLRVFQGRLDAVGAVSLTAALFLYVLRPARSRP